LTAFADSQTAAEWVAAVGTVAAILAAIWLGQRSLAEERNRIAARARVTAFRLAPHIVTIRGDVARAQQAVKQAMNPSSAVFQNLMQIAQAMVIHSAIPQDVFAETWTLPPHVALAVAQLESQIANHARLVDNIGGVVIGLTQNDQAKEILHAVEASLSAMERLALEIQSHCAAVSDAVVRTRRSSRQPD